MPYVDKIPDREFLNPHIDKIVHFIEQHLENSADAFNDYAKYIKFVWAELACLLYKKYIGTVIWHPFAIQNSISREFQNMIYGLYSVIIQLAERHNHKGAFAGDLNYSCTESALRTWPTKHYWSISLLGGITQRVGHELLKIFYPNDAIGDQIIGVFMNDIPAELYRRIVAEYEDAKIRESGDVSGYLKWLPTEKKGEKDDRR